MRISDVNELALELATEITNNRNPDGWHVNMIKIGPEFPVPPNYDRAVIEYAAMITNEDQTLKMDIEWTAINVDATNTFDGIGVRTAKLQEREETNPC